MTSPYRPVGRVAVLALVLALGGCGSNPFSPLPGPTDPPAPDATAPPGTAASPAPSPSRLEGNGELPVTTGAPFPPADLTGRPRNLTDNPANDWGPDWSPDGELIAFNSDRDGFPLTGYLVHPDGSGLRRVPGEA